MKKTYNTLINAIHAGNTDLAMAIIKVLEEEVSRTDNPDIRALLRMAAENGHIERKGELYVPKHRQLSIVTYSLEPFKEE